MAHKLIYILNQYSSQEGSHFFHVLNLLEEIANNGVDIVLIIEKASSIPAFSNPGIRVIVQKKSGLSRSFELYRIIKRLNSQGYRKVFVRISQKGAIPPIIVSKLYGGEVYFWHSGTTHVLEKEMPFNFGKIKWYFNSKLPFIFVKTYVNFFVTGPEEMLKYYRDEVKVKSEKLMCLYNDIDITRFDKDNEDLVEIKTRLKIGSEKIILFAHRLSPVRKSLYYMPMVLEKMLKTHPDYVCYVLGGGGEQPELKRSISEKGLEERIKVLGEKPNKEIQDYYKIANIFINPTYTEGFPRVILEAMAAGLPIVTTDAGGTRDLLCTSQRRFLVDKNDRELFSARLMELANDNHLQQCLSRENVNHVKRFSTQKVASMYITTIFGNE